LCFGSITLSWSWSRMVLSCEEYWPQLVLADEFREIAALKLILQLLSAPSFLMFIIAVSN
jgi:hypothetical protein